ncbi:MAG: glycogen synthase [Calditrichaeota bacterium]|nr:MAG: glycogen synthase [Calditrichota bacterium]MBL1203881.1 glycogen synthase [Calditrichota bacterium]NOG43713.1 glycogen synthase [Calditrichota bacterium]
MPKKIKIALVSSEIFPFSKTGGLADVSGALGKYLSKNNVDVRLITPLYSDVDLSVSNFYPVKFLQDMELWFGSHKYSYSVHTAKIPDTAASVYFISCPELYNRESLYTNDVDEHIRFALLSRAAIEICQKMAWAPDVFHCNDWQSALLPLYLKTHYSWDSLFSKSKTLLSIHNIGYQGSFNLAVINDLGFADFTHLLDDFDNKSGQFNFMKLGVIHSDKLSTVSKTYAQEIQTEEYGAGLDPMLAYRKENLVGIVNGVDYEEWDPENDTNINFPFSINKLSGKKKNKQSLLDSFDLEFSIKRPLIGMITRLVEQKGLDLIIQVLENFLAHKDMQVVVLGSGDPKYVEFFTYLKNKYPAKLGFFSGYNNKLAHLIEAGSDMFLMPSKYEPCGLNQIYSLKYGTIPIVRKTGGLADTVDLYDWEKQSGTGFVFEDYSAEGLDWAIDYALETFKHTKAWKKIISNAMKQDYSWDRQVKEYIKLYSALLKSK